MWGFQAMISSIAAVPALDRLRSDNIIPEVFAFEIIDRLFNIYFCL